MTEGVNNTDAETEGCFGHPKHPIYPKHGLSPETSQQYKYKHEHFNSKTTGVKAKCKVRVYGDIRNLSFSINKKIGKGEVIKFMANLEVGSVNILAWCDVSNVIQPTDFKNFVANTYNSELATNKSNKPKRMSKFFKNNRRIKPV